MQVAVRHSLSWKAQCFDGSGVNVWWKAHYKASANEAQFFVDGTVNIWWTAHWNAVASKAQSFVDGTLTFDGRHILMQVPVRHSLSLTAHSFLDGTVNVWLTIYCNAGASKAQSFLKSTMFRWRQWKAHYKASASEAQFFVDGTVNVWLTAHSNAGASKAHYFLDGTVSVWWTVHCNAGARKAQSFIDDTVFRWWHSVLMAAV